MAAIKCITFPCEIAGKSVKIKADVVECNIPLHEKGRNSSIFKMNSLQQNRCIRHYESWALYFTYIQFLCIRKDRGRIVKHWLY